MDAGVKTPQCPHLSSMLFWLFYRVINIVEVYTCSLMQHWGTKCSIGWSRCLHAYLDLCLPFLSKAEVGGRLAELLEIIGVDKQRLVSGVVRAKTVYQPRSTGCGFANVQESQVLSRLYRDYIRRTFPRQPRNRLILIRRSGLRRFFEQKSIEAATRRVAADFNLTYTLFVDNPTPSLNDTMMMFHSAVVVVGPHGAGLSNVFFSQPGTYVVEGVCNLPHVNMCFQRLTHVLGHHWHGVTSRRGCQTSGRSQGNAANAVERRSWAPKNCWRAFPGPIQPLMARAH